MSKLELPRNDRSPYQHLASVDMNVIKQSIT